MNFELTALIVGQIVFLSAVNLANNIEKRSVLKLWIIRNCGDLDCDIIKRATFYREDGVSSKILVLI
jgi:hypothetical protein